MNKEYIKLNDGTILVSDEKGHISAKRKSNHRLLVNENKTEIIIDEINEIDDYINSDEKSVSFLEKLLVAQPFLLAAVSGVMCMGASSSVIVNVLISGIVISPITVCLGSKIKSLKKEINELNAKKETAYNLLDQYKNEWCEEKVNVYLEERNEKKVIDTSEIKVHKLHNQEIINDVDKELEKPFVKTLTRKRYK